MDNVKQPKPINSNLIPVLVFATSLFLAANWFVVFVATQPTVCEVYLHPNPNQTHVYQGVKK